MAYKRYYQGTGLNSKGIPKTPEGWGHWLAGLVDGEGSFMLIQRTANRATEARFSMTLRHDDTPILQEIQRTLGLGKIHGPYIHSAGSLNQQPQVRWDVAARGDCEILRRFFLRYPLRTKKRVSFQVWAEAVKLRNRRKGIYSAQRRTELQSLRWKLQGNQQKIGGHGMPIRIDQG
jgi:hypothetical protein